MSDVAESSAKRVKGSVLVVAGAVLILLIVIMLLSLRRPIDEQIEREAAGAPAPAPGAGSWKVEPAPPRSAPAPKVAAPPAPPRPEGPVRVEAPPAIPSELQNETDPVRRAQLEKLHKLATARVRLSRLTRRERMLTESLARAKKDGSWSQQKILEAERDLVELAAGIKAAARRLDEVRAEVGGDIDK
jgi:hypothetical protein